MKMRIIILTSCLLLGSLFLLAFNSPAQHTDKQSQSKYIIARHVIGSGGVMGATGTNYFHSATAGEPAVGFMQSTNNLLLSGYWHAAAAGPAGVEQKDDKIVPAAFNLHQNYPNPFNPQTTIVYDLPHESSVTIEILNLVGQRIRLLLNSQSQGPGTVHAVWNGVDDQGKLMGSGIYIYRVSVYENSSGSQTSRVFYQQSKKMLFVK